MLLNIVNNIWDFIHRLTESTLNLDLIFYIGTGLLVFMVLFFMIKSHFAYEGRLERSLEKLNRWLYSHQQLDETNLVEFNMLIKKAPKLLRYHWQQYMLYREGEPSKYLSVFNCIEKPLHTSSYASNIKNFTGMMIATMTMCFFLALSTFRQGGTNIQLSVEALSLSIITPIIVLGLGVIFLIVLRAMQNFNMNNLYQNFHLFNRYLDRASSSIPKYVDFEILFTRKEIKGGIPVLNEYLEKRARQEAEEIEKAKQNTVEHQQYNFEESGIDGSLILDRAMKESETFLNANNRLLSQMRQYESEIESLKRNYENTSKDYARKLQASKENIERLRQQQEESTNRIEVNYIRKQQQDEIKKQEQLEKDHEDATVRFNSEVESLNKNIEECRTQANEKKETLTAVMLGEYKTFATKVYDTILEDVKAKHKEELVVLGDQKLEALKEVQKQKEINEIKDSVIADLKELIAQVSETSQAENNFVAQEIEQPVEEQFVAQEEQPVEENNVAELFDEEQAARELAELQRLAEVEEEPAVEEQPMEEIQQEEIVEEQPMEETQQEEIVEEQPVEEVAQEEQAEEMGGHYDDRGYFIFDNGTYYDNEGKYHDGTGNIYNSEGNLVGTEEIASEQPVEEIANEENAVDVEETNSFVEELKEELAKTEEELQPETEDVIATEEVAKDEDVDLPILKDDYDAAKHMDDNGNYVFANGAYYDAEGNYHHTDGKVYDENGNLIENYVKPQQETVEDKTEEVEEAKDVEDETSDVEDETSDVEELTEEVEEEEVEEEDEEEEDKTSAPKKRGRPKSTSGATAAKKPSTGAKRGRPKGSTNNENKEEEPKTTSTGKRGRPKSSTNSENKEEEPKTASTAKRGRPKGSTSSTTAAKKPSTGATRGRPKSTTPKVEDGEKPAPKKRGRPKKIDIDELTALNDRIKSERDNLVEQQNQLSKQLDAAVEQLKEHNELLDNDED